jgi:hypothetical protein
VSDGRQPESCESVKRKLGSWSEMAVNLRVVSFSVMRNLGGWCKMAANLRVVS